MSNSLELSALDGANPLGFLAALGTLVVLSEDDSQIKLGWREAAYWTPYLTSTLPLKEDEVLQQLASKLKGNPVDAEKEKARDAALRTFEAVNGRLKKQKEAFKKRGLRGKDRAAAYAAEIQPVEEEAKSCRRDFLEKLNVAVPSPELSIGKKVDLGSDEFRAKARQFLDEKAGSLSSAGMLAALATEGNAAERSTRSAFNFIDSSGRLAFLETARQLMLEVSAGRLRAALCSRWQRNDEKWSLRFDPVEDRRYALLDRDPTAGDNKSRTEWMANLLAYRALLLFPCAQTRSGPATTGWRRAGNEASFTWPIWRSPLRMDAVRSLMSHSALRTDRISHSLRQLGLAAAYRSRRIENGDYINFSPAEGVL